MKATAHIDLFGAVEPMDTTACSSANQADTCALGEYQT
jgi:hypothetical protein